MDVKILDVGPNVGSIEIRSSVREALDARLACLRKAGYRVGEPAREAGEWVALVDHEHARQLEQEAA